MSRYSCGSGNSSGDRYISASLPSCGQHAVHAEQRAERVAVGVLVRGRAAKLVGARAAPRRTWSSCGPRAAHDLVSPSISSSSSRDPHRRARALRRRRRRARRVLDAQLARDAAPAGSRATTRGPSSVSRALVLVAEHADVHARMAQVWARVDGCHGDESNAGVFQASGDVVAEKGDLPRGARSTAACGRAGILSARSAY